MQLALIPLALAMGDPNFIPASPSGKTMDSNIDPMIQTQGNLNQIHQGDQPQREEERKYNQNENQKELDYRLDDAFQEATETEMQKTKTKEDSYE